MCIRDRFNSISATQVNKTDITASVDISVVALLQKLDNTIVFNTHGDVFTDLDVSAQHYHANIDCIIQLSQTGSII